MVSEFLRVMRNRKVCTAEFRKASHSIAKVLIAELWERLKKKGVKKDVVLVVILRAGIAFLDAALRVFPSAQVAVAGLKRDEKTAIAYWYYENFPEITKETTVVILDPMLATGGSAVEAVKKITEYGADLKQTYFVGVIAAPQGLKKLSRLIPRRNIILASVDKGLDARKFIVPGLGDYGDRYFGYEEVKR